MQTLKFFALGVVLFFANYDLAAQVSVTINTGANPAWGPTGYADTRYYYLPDIETYYDVQSGQFIYYEGGWIQRAYLPVRYKSYDLYRGYKVVLTDYGGSTPYLLFKEHKHKYYKGYRNGKQKTYGERPGNSIGGNANKSYKSDEKHMDFNSGGKGHGGGQGHGHSGGKGKK